MAEGSTTPAGQAPASGQDPQGTGTTAPAGQDPAEQFDPERARALIAKLRDEAKAATKRIGEMEAAQKAADDAKLSDTERLTKRAAQLEAELAHERTEKQDRINHYETQLAASKLGIVDPEAAVKLLDWSNLEYDEDGRPKEIDKALAALLKAKPYLAAQATPGRPPASPTNPARPTQGAEQTFTVSQLKDFRFYQTHKEAINQAMREGRIVQG